jgi:hypothetical protein
VAQAIYRRNSPRAESVALGAAHFAFTRIRYTSSNSWSHDYPAADRNLSAILDYATNMRVKLDETNVLTLDDPRVLENPIIYISESGYWVLRDTEVIGLLHRLRHDALAAVVVGRALSGSRGPDKGRGKWLVVSKCFLGT